MNDYKCPFEAEKAMGWGEEGGMGFEDTLEILVTLVK